MPISSPSPTGLGALGVRVREDTTPMYQRNGQHYAGVDILPSLPDYARHKASLVAAVIFMALAVIASPAFAAKPASLTVDVADGVLGLSLIHI